MPLFAAGHPSEPFRAAVLVPVADALAAMIAASRPLAPTEVAIGDAIGCVLAEALVATESVPAQALALRAGYAVVASTTAGAGSYAPVALTQPPAWVEIAGALPPGRDAVLPAHALQVEAGAVEVVDAAAPGHWVRRAGEDLARGATLRDAGALLRPLDAAVALAAGLPRAAIRRPRVAIVAGSDAAPASARAWLAALCVDCGAIVVSGHEPGQSDVAVVLGPGSNRHPASQETAFLAAGLALRPGEDARVAVAAGAVVVELPDRLDVALAVGLVLLRPYLLHLTGAIARSPSPSMTLSRKIVSTVGLTELALLRERGGLLEPLATGDLTLAVMAAATHWLVLPPESEGAERGTEVAAEPL